MIGKPQVKKRMIRTIVRVNKTAKVPVIIHYPLIFMGNGKFKFGKPEMQEEGKVFKGMHILHRSILVADKGNNRERLYVREVLQ